MRSRMLSNRPRSAAFAGEPRAALPARLSLSMFSPSSFPAQRGILATKPGLSLRAAGGAGPAAVPATPRASAGRNRRYPPPPPSTPPTPHPEPRCLPPFPFTPRSGPAMHSQYVFLVSSSTTSGFNLLLDFPMAMRNGLSAGAWRAAGPGAGHGGPYIPGRSGALRSLLPGFGAAELRGRSAPPRGRSRPSPRSLRAPSPPSAGWGAGGGPVTLGPTPPKLNGRERGGNGLL